MKYIIHQNMTTIQLYNYPITILLMQLLQFSLDNQGFHCPPFSEFLFLVIFPGWNSGLSIRNSLS